MKFRGLTLFSKTSDKNRWIIASWHNPHSLTWRWSLSFAWVPSGQAGMFHVNKHNSGRTVILALKWLRFDFNTQQPMWYREIARRQRQKDYAA